MKLNKKKFAETRLYDDLVEKVKITVTTNDNKERMLALNYILGVEDTINMIYGTDYHCVNSDDYVGIQNQMDKSDFLYLRLK